MLSVIMLSVIMLSVIMLSVIMLSVIYAECRSALNAVFTPINVQIWDRIHQSFST
jgi:hypothetical protein